MVDTKKIGEVKIICHMCKQELKVKNAISIGQWTFHYECYKVALKRLTQLADILLASEEDFIDWMKDCSS